jgi:STE24 endopeptidase
MNTRRRRRGFAAGPSLALALGGALAVAEGAVLLLRPRRGLIAPDPVSVEEHFSAEEVARLRAFSRPQLALYGARALSQTAVLVALTARPPRPLRRRPSSRRDRLALAAATGAGLTTALTAASLPAGALARRRALRAGLATQSWPAWAKDVAKGTAISAVLTGAVAPAAVSLVGHRPRGWWLPGAGAMVAGGAAATFLSPVVLDPLFNRFRPLPDGSSARSDVLDLAGRAGVDVGEVFEVDASRRTTAANAYVTGLGATKRVVLFDTLLARFTRDEARLVVAHELAHVRHRDVAFGLLHTAVVAPAALHAAAVLFGRVSVGRTWNPPEPPTAAALPALALALGIAGAVTGSVAGQLSRRVEARADAFSLRLTDAPDPFISFERRICLQNLADPDPPRWIVALMGSHPPTVERIGIARAYARGSR